MHRPLKTLFFTLGQHLKQPNTQARYVIDSFLIAHDGLPVKYCILAGREADSTGLRAPGPQLPEGSAHYADAGSIDCALEELWRESEHVALTVDRQKNSKWLHVPL